MNVVDYFFNGEFVFLAKRNQKLSYKIHQSINGRKSRDVILPIRCRADVSLMPVLRKYMYTDVMALCPVFVEAWAHFDKLTHFPKIT
jgi:hypothetical protein